MYVVRTDRQTAGAEINHVNKRSCQYVAQKYMSPIVFRKTPNCKRACPLPNMQLNCSQLSLVRKVSSVASQLHHQTKVASQPVSSPLRSGSWMDGQTHSICVSSIAFPAGIVVSGPVHVICGRTGCKPLLDCHLTTQLKAVNSVFHCSIGSSEAAWAWMTLGNGGSSGTSRKIFLGSGFLDSRFTTTSRTT